MNKLKFQTVSDRALLARADQVASQQFSAWCKVMKSHPSRDDYPALLKAEVLLFKEWRLILKEVYNNRHHKTWLKLQRQFPSEDLERYNPATY